MSRSPKPATLVITDTDQLSAIAGALVARCGASGLSKNTVLNLIAAGLKGPKTNWGGLKSMSSPVAASPLADTLLATPAIQAEILSVHPSPRPYCFEGRSLILHFRHPRDGARYDVAVALTDLPAIEAALFGANGKRQYSTTSATVRRANGSVQFFAKTEGHPLAIEIEDVVFQTFLAEHRAFILDAILADGTGESLHRAFISIAEGQGEDILFDVAQSAPHWEDIIHAESATQHTQRIDHACREAVWIFLAGCTDHPDRYLALRRGMDELLADEIFDASWSLLATVLHMALCKELGAAA